MSYLDSMLAIQRLNPGPFGGVFDDILYEHPAFILWVVVTIVLVGTLLVTAWLLMGHSRERESWPSRQRSFEVIRKRDTTA